MNDEKATCRWCKRELRGKPYYMGGQAYHIFTRKLTNKEKYIQS